mmetsp:Transcript_38990/g.70226  ORF Transcript_38990/g.70226 Transcript_38990/m.70226 type:complete len:724 (+) Transcript_38990:79-2250(+)
MKMGIASIIGGPFKASINQRAITAYVVQQDSDIDCSSAEVDFPSDMAIRFSKNESHKNDSCLLLVCKASGETRAGEKRAQEKEGLSETMRHIAASSSHISATDSGKHRVSMFTIVRRHSESMQAGASFWRLSRVSPSEYRFMSGGNLEASTRGEVVLSDHGINLEAIQQTMKELELSAASTWHDFDLCPKDKSSKLTFESTVEADLFEETTHSLLKDERSIRTSEHNHQDGLSSGAKQRRCSDKTGLVITVPRTPAAETNFLSAYDGSNKRRKRDYGLSLATIAASENDVDSVKESLDQTMITSSAGAVRDGKDFYFILPTDMDYLTDYLFLLYAQVKKGVMNDTDLAKANRAKYSKLNMGFPGMRCRHCGGNERGNYFPSSVKNLAACTATLHTHLIKCEETPAAVIRALKMTKCTHKFQVISKPQGAQSVFFSQLWERIHSETFNGVDGSGLYMLADKLNNIVEKSALKSTNETAIPNIVSYDEYTDHQALSQNRTNKTSIVTDEDFGIALDLLRRAPTPDISDNNLLYGDAPPIDITPAPVNQVAVKSPIATKISSSGERYHNGSFVVSKKKKTKGSKRGHEEGKTRKFSIHDEILLVKGMIKHGKKNCWKKIYDEQPGLHHIKHSALKDRARSRRFKEILERAELDPSLLGRPDELCGSPDQPAYTEGRPAQPARSKELDAEEIFSDSHPSSVFESEANEAIDEQPDLTFEIDEYYRED